MQDDAVRRVPEAVTHEAERDDRVVVRPYCPNVVPDRVEPAVVARKRPHAPPGEHPIGHELFGDDARALLGNDPRPEQVAHVRRYGVDLTLVAVESDEVVA